MRHALCPIAEPIKEELMKRTSIIGLIIFLAASVLSGCGGDGGAAAPDPNAPASVALTPSKTAALANGIDAITIVADVSKADGTAVPDGTVVSFSVPGTAGNLSAPTAACSGGLASVTLTHPSISVNNTPVIVTAAAGDKSRNMAVKFINQPTSVEVSIGFGIAVTNLTTLKFQLNNTAGASFNNGDPADPANPQLISAINGGAASLVAGNFIANSNTIGLVSFGGFNTGTAPIIRATYAVAAGDSLPTFSVAETGFSATDLDGNATVPQVTAADMVVTTVFDTE
jgi:hypothetical protein